MSANTDLNLHSEVNSQTPHNSVEDLHGLLLRLQIPYTELSVLQSDTYLDREKLEVQVFSHPDPNNQMNNVSKNVTRFGWSLRNDKTLFVLSLTCYEIGYMLNPHMDDAQDITPTGITDKMNFILSQLNDNSTNMKIEKVSSKDWITYIRSVINAWIWKFKQSETHTQANPSTVSGQQDRNNVPGNKNIHTPKLQNDRGRQFHKDWVAWTSGDKIYYTKDGHNVKSDFRSNWVQFVNFEDIQYYKPINGHDCYAYVPRRESQYGERPHVYPQSIKPPHYTHDTTFIPVRQNTYNLPTGVYRDQNSGKVYQVYREKLDSQETVSDLAGPVDEVRPCHCGGCPVCDDKSGHC
jgi:hypothetical protein